VPPPPVRAPDGSKGEAAASDALTDPPKRRRTGAHEHEREREVPAGPADYADLASSRRRRIRSYYSRGQYHGIPPSYVLHRVADCTRHRGGDADVLWWATVGISEALTHGRLDAQGYEALGSALRAAAVTHGDLPATAARRVLCAPEHRLCLLRH